MLNQNCVYKKCIKYHVNHAVIYLEIVQICPKYVICILLFNPCTHHLVFYAIVLHSNEEHTVPLIQLEDHNGLALSKKDATIDASVIWMHKGKTPYEATIVGIRTDKGKTCT